MIWCLPLNTWFSHYTAILLISLTRTDATNDRFFIVRKLNETKMINHKKICNSIDVRSQSTVTELNYHFPLLIIFKYFDIFSCTIVHCTSQASVATSFFFFSFAILFNCRLPAGKILCVSFWFHIRIIWTGAIIHRKRRIRLTHDNVIRSYSDSINFNLFKQNIDIGSQRLRVVWLCTFIILSYHLKLQVFRLNA